MKWDRPTLIGLVVGIGAILIGQVAEGGHVSSLLQGTAALIVFGGTLGAVLVSSTKYDLVMGYDMMKEAFKENDAHRPEEIIAEMTRATQLARKESILALEKNMKSFSHPYMKKVFRFVVDGADSKTLTEIFENEIYLEEQRLNGGAKVWMDAGGFAPTIGIIGAVLGLIHVMQNLSDTAGLGKGIAVAFVATVYGVGSANLIFFPIGNKIKKRIKDLSLQKELILNGAIAIVSGSNPAITHEKMNSYLNDRIERS